MRLFDHPGAPSPRRVRIFLAEKGLEVPKETVDLAHRAQFDPAFRSRNPACTVPALQLDDGTVLGDSLAICRYFEALHPDPPLFGRDPREIGLVEAWLRRVELELYQPVADHLRNTSPRFEGRALSGFPEGLPQIPALAERARVVASRVLASVEAALGAGPFLAGAAFSTADVWLFTTIGFAEATSFPLLEGRPHLEAWYARVGARPSAGA